MKEVYKIIIFNHLRGNTIVELKKVRKSVFKFIV